MANIDATSAGLPKPVEKNVGIIWYAEAGVVEIEDVTGSVDLETLGLKNAGAITTDGITLASNSSDPETYLDWNGNTIDSSEATSTQSIQFSVLQVQSEDAAALVFANSAITATLGKVSKITGTGNPSNKTIVIDTRIKNTRYRTILPEASFAGRGDDGFVNDTLYSWEVTYNVLTDADGNDIIRLFTPIV